VSDSAYGEAAEHVPLRATSAGRRDDGVLLARLTVVMAVAVVVGALIGVVYRSRVPRSRAGAPSQAGGGSESSSSSSGRAARMARRPGGGKRSGIAGFGDVVSPSQSSATASGSLS